MDKQVHINLASIFRVNPDRSSNASMTIKEQLMEQKCNKVEKQATSFLLDGKFTRNLDELI